MTPQEALRDALINAIASVNVTADILDSPLKGFLYRRLAMEDTHRIADAALTVIESALREAVNLPKVDAGNIDVYSQYSQTGRYEGEIIRVQVTKDEAERIRKALTGEPA
jgi:hypothetical protein